MKTCGKCGKSKSLDSFSWKSKVKGTKQWACKSCHKELRTEHYEKNKEKIYTRIKERQQEIKDLVWLYKNNHTCVDCGESDPVVLEFDHLRDKEFNISGMVLNGMSWKNILAEIEKCEVVCCNDHRRRTHQRGKWIRNICV